MKLNSLIIRILDSFGAFEKVSDRCLVGQDSAQYSDDIERCSSKLAVVLDDSHEAVCDDCNIYLYSHSVLTGSPKGEHAEMLFYPPEEQFNLPSLFVEHCNVLSLDRKVIRKRTDALNSIQSGKVIVAFVKDIERIRLIRYLIHRLHIVEFRFRNVNVCRNLRDHIKQGVHLGSALGFAEVCPLEQTHAEIYRRRIERVELAIENERPCDSLALGKVDHMVGKLLKYLVISVGVSIRQIAQLYVSATETEMVALALDGINDCSDFSEAITARELSEHHDKELIPTGEMLHPFITHMSFYNAIKDSFRKKTDELTEYIFACIHACPILWSEANMRNQFKSTRDFSLCI